MAKMTHPTRHTRRHMLEQRQVLVLAQAQGTEVVVDRGSVWITLERDPRDIVLVPGMRFGITRPGRTIITAEAPSSLRLLIPETLRDRVIASTRRALARWFSSSAGRLVRRAVPYF